MFSTRRRRLADPDQENIDPRPSKRVKTDQAPHQPRNKRAPLKRLAMSLFRTNANNLPVPSFFSGRGFKRSAPASAVRNKEMDEFLASDNLDAELEFSFASNMSLNSPPRDSPLSTPESENLDHVPMDISPAPARLAPSRTEASIAATKPFVGRPRANTSGPRLFGRDMSNGVETSSMSKSGTASGGKRLQRAALPLEWMAQPSPGCDENSYSKPIDMPSSPTDAMDIDTSFTSSSAPDSGPLSAAPTITTFNLDRYGPSAPVSAAPTISTFRNLFYEAGSPPRVQPGEETEVEDIVANLSTTLESPYQPFPKKRRSSSPDRQSLRKSHQHLFDDEDIGYTSSPAASSPTAHKLERVASSSLLANQKRPSSLGLGLPVGINANKKRPRRPALSAMISPSDSPAYPQSAYPIPSSDEKENEVAPVKVTASRLPPARRAFSAMLPPTLLDQSMSSEDNSFDADPDMSSPAQAYAKRQHVKTIRRCDGTDDFRPLTGATALVRHDTEILSGQGLRRSEERIGRTATTIAERDTPRSKYLNAASGLGGFGDNEAYGKILPCHRVREDGLMRIKPSTLNDLLDGAYNSQIDGFHIIDCRFDYEYNGGHVPSAMNINTTAGVEEFFLGLNKNKPVPSTSDEPCKKTIIVFHCEFSVKRAPTFAKQLRSKDRAMNGHVYPKVHYPEVYILEGGYSRYYEQSSARCQPRGYVRMDDPHYAISRREDLDNFRKGKFGRTKSYAFGENKGTTSGLMGQPKRNTAPSGGPALFAAANAARSRRTGLSALQEDGSGGHHSEDEETDIGDSPCPPPSKGVVFKGKKIGRAPLARAETYGPMRMGY